jgi:hypothetical protein
MQFPQRTQSHITESESWRLLQELAPRQWIVREISERDYGIDAYVEIATESGDITGNLISLQLKGVNNIAWREEVGVSKKASTPQVKTSTANYWLGLPIPVFLLVADLTARNVYYATVEPQLRNHYGTLSTQNSITLTLDERADLRTEEGRSLFTFLIARERLQPDFVFQITTLLNSVQTFADFILTNQGYDQFLDVDDERHLQFRAIYDCLQTSSFILEGSWPIESLRDLYLRDRGMFKDDYAFLHENTLDYALRKLQVVFPRLVRRALDLVLNKQPDYWRRKDPAFYHLCKGGHAERALARFEEQCQPASG